MTELTEHNGKTVKSIKSINGNIYILFTDGTAQVFESDRNLNIEPIFVANPKSMLACEQLSKDAYILYVAQPTELTSELSLSPEYILELKKFYLEILKDEVTDLI